MNEMDGKKARRGKGLKITAVLLLLLGAVGYGYFRYQHPYGSSHHCSKMFPLFFHEYAEDHDGNYPSAGGEAASLALLVDYGMPVKFLAGKSVSPSDTEKYYAQHGTLSDEVCGWHYVEGLKNTDPSELAIMWPKVPLGHNGERLKRPAYEVIFIDGSIRYIEVTKWQGFLADQERLRTSR
ncbi:hypothetical protein NT6N_31710 [Oceaniferula spumae]|uniref:Uncharacterized protein n=1 Tax=Oceaniferula spumae TaxID=2979115 RepID=A0AAT9FQG6_9BACT